MKDKLLIVAALLFASRVEAQTPPLSQAAKDAFYEAHLCEPSYVPPGALASLGSRRFAATALTYKVQNAGAAYVSVVNGTMAKIAAKMAGVQVWTRITSGTPNVNWRIGSSYVDPATGQTVALTNGCVFVPKTFAGGNPRTIATSEVVCKTASQVGENLAMHELWWHGFLSYCDLNCPNSFACHATANGAPNYEGVPGHQELVRWLNTVPAGSFPPQ